VLENMVQKILLICLDNITIKNLKSLDLIAKLFFKPLLNHLVKGY